MGRQDEPLGPHDCLAAMIGLRRLQHTHSIKYSPVMLKYFDVAINFRYRQYSMH